MRKFEQALTLEDKEQRFPTLLTKEDLAKLGNPSLLSLLPEELIVTMMEWFPVQDRIKFGNSSRFFRGIRKQYFAKDLSKFIEWKFKAQLESDFSRQEQHSLSQASSLSILLEGVIQTIPSHQQERFLTALASNYVQRFMLGRRSLPILLNLSILFLVTIGTFVFTHVHCTERSRNPDPGMLNTITDGVSVLIVAGIYLFFTRSCKDRYRIYRLSKSSPLLHSESYRRMEEATFPSASVEEVRDGDSAANKKAL